VSRAFQKKSACSNYTTLGEMKNLHEAAVVLVTLCWLAMGVTHLFRKGRGAPREAKRDRGWRLGVLLQAVGVALVWAVQRNLHTPLHPGLAALVAVLGAGGVWFMTAAENTLGRQFAYPARLIEGHKLITTGPYGIVRHPIYLAFFSVILATALTFSNWLVLPPFVAFYWAGAAIRIRSEERLLREAFPKEYAEYARRVPAVIPFA
jgi:protein-S-isoprenylcysteine O-methyltransferase Ste14